MMYIWIIALSLVGTYTLVLAVLRQTCGRRNPGWHWNGSRTWGIMEVDFEFGIGTVSCLMPLVDPYMQQLGGGAQVTNGVGCQTK